MKSRLKITLQVLGRTQDTHHPYVFHSPFRERRGLLGIRHCIHGSFGLVTLVSMSRLAHTAVGFIAQNMESNLDN